jgi:hypothetical protein
VTSVEGLEPDDQLTYWVGTVARGDVVIHAAAQELFVALVGAENPSVALVQPELGRVLTSCKAMLPRVEGAPDWLAVEGGAAIQSAVDARTERNRYIHDALIALPNEPGAWHRLKPATLTSPAPSPTRITLAQLRKCRDDLVTASWRLQGLSRFLQNLRYPYAADSGIDQDFEQEAARVVLRGRFELNRDRTGISYFPVLDHDFG